MIYAQFSSLIMVRWPFAKWNEHANKHTNWSGYNYELKPVKYATFNGSFKIILIIIGETSKRTSERVDVGDDRSSRSSGNDNNNNNNDISS